MKKLVTQNIVWFAGDKMETSVTKSVRNTNIEVLRLLLMCFIFFGHVIGHGLDMYHVEYGGSHHALLLCLSSLFAPSVFCFMFISGFYGIRFSLRKFMLLAVMVLLALAAVQLRWIWLDGFSLSSLDPFGPWWFMNYYMVIFILSPLIEKGVLRMDKGAFQVLLFVLLCFIVLELVHRQTSNTLEGLLTVYLLGCYCAKYNVAFGVRKALIVFACCYAALCGMEIMCDFIPLPAPYKVQGKLLSYNNPLIIAMAVSLFYFVHSLKPKFVGGVNKCLRSCLFIYLLTEGISKPLYKYVADVFTQNFLLGLSLSFAIICLCLAAGHLLTETARRIVYLPWTGKEVRR